MAGPTGSILRRTEREQRELSHQLIVVLADAGEHLQREVQKSDSD